MRFVILLGVLALMAFSTAAENQEKAIDLPEKDVLIREVRGGERKQSKRKSGKKTSKKRKLKKSRKTKKNKDAERKRGKGNRKTNKRNRGNKKGNKGKKKNRNRKGGKSASIVQNNRQDFVDCPAFYNELDTTAVRDFRYARNQIQKAKRVKNSIKKLEKLTAKAAEAFLDGAAFFKDCIDPRAPIVYEGLRQCNVTAADACNPADLIAENLNSLEEIDECIDKLNRTMASSEPCLQKGNCNETFCRYEPIGQTSDTCDYRKFDRDVAKLINSKCSNSTYEGSFSWCNNLLKDSYSIASNCFILPPVTTVAPSTGRLRKSLNIWKV